MIRNVLLIAGALAGLTFAASAAEAHEKLHGPMGLERDFGRDFGFAFRGPSSGRLGVRVQPMSQELRKYFGAPDDAGVLVNEVLPESPASKAGLLAGDVILEVDGTKVEDVGDLVSELAEKTSGEVLITVLRDKKKTSLTAKIEPRQELDVRGFETNDQLRRQVDEQRVRIDELDRRLEKLEKRK